MGYTFTWDDLEKICHKLGMDVAIQSLSPARPG